MSQGARRWTIGELARAGGVTVRMLHHYDRIGLVSASERTAAGHRRYTEADVRRFYRVRALCGLGLSLGEVAAALREPEDLRSLRDLLTAQLAALEDQSARLAEAASRVRGLLDRLAGEVMPEPEQFLSTLEPLRIDVEQYLTEEQRAALTQRAAELGADTVEALKSEWLTVADQLRQHVQDGTPADDPAVAALVERWGEIANAFHPGAQEPGLARLWEEKGEELGAELDQRIGWQEPVGMADVVDYVNRARQQ